MCYSIKNVNLHKCLVLNINLDKNDQTRARNFSYP